MKKMITPNSRVDRRIRTREVSLLLRDVVRHLRRNRVELCEECIRRTRCANLLPTRSDREVLAEAISLFDDYIAKLESGGCAATLPQTARAALTGGATPRPSDHEAPGLMLVMHGVIGRSLFKHFRHADSRHPFSSAADRPSFEARQEQTARTISFAAA